ncbi:MAG: carbon-nitrogen hydrolase family protein [Fibrobacter sp.]|nr:carbon-nitrogen hydrolase family protein [Fibrobacter sp.]
MVKSYKIALCQITPSMDKDESVARAFSMIEKAASEGAVLIGLPEMFYSPLDLRHIRKICGNEEDILNECRNLAKRLGVYICSGSMAYPEAQRIYNRSFLIDCNGRVVLSYSKTHLYDVNFRNFQVRESSLYTAGTGISTVETELGRIGIIICYDIRFPELLRHNAVLGADLIIAPSVFNAVSGPAHWHVMMRARAIENQLFMAAISQGRNLDTFYKSYGHSMVVSPWGDILSEADETEQILYAQIDLQLIAETRAKLPLLQHRREELYH